MGVYAFVFSCIGIGVLLWILSGVLGDAFRLSVATITQITNVGTIMFVIGVISLAVVFLISYFKNK